MFQLNAGDGSSNAPLVTFNFVGNECGYPSKAGDHFNQLCSRVACKTWNGSWNESGMELGIKRGMESFASLCLLGVTNCWLLLEWYVLKPTVCTCM